MIRKFTPFVALFLCSLTSPAQIFFSEDFSGGIPGGWTNVDISGHNITWRVTTTGATSTGLLVNSELSPVGTSALNGYLILDSDSAGSGSSEDAILITPAVNCSAHSSVRLQFNEYFAQYAASLGNVEVSNDSINWINVHMAHTGLSQDQGTPNPNAVEVDISAIAANQPTVYIRFRYQGAWDYWWFVDDISLYEPYAVDLMAYSIEDLNREYTMIPLSQAAGFMIHSEIKNNGVNATSAGTASLDIVDSSGTNVLFNEVVNLPAIPVGGIQSVVSSTPFNPVAAGKCKARVTVTIPGDGNGANDIKESGLLVVSDSVYARDDGNIASVLPIGAGGGEDGAVGHNFRINTTAYMTSVSVFLKDSLTQYYTGTPFFITVHPQLVDTLNPDGSIVLATSETLMINSGTIPPGGAFFTLALPGGGIQLVPGLYFLAMHEVDSLIPFAYSNSIFTNYTIWAHWNSIPSPPAINGWARIEDLNVHPVYMLRANLGQSPDYVSGEAPLPSEDLVFPNPSSGVFTYCCASSGEDSYIEVTDAFGRLVFHHVVTEKVFLVDLSNYANGIYQLRRISSGNQEVKRLVLAR